MINILSTRRIIDLYFEASILQTKPHAGCQVYAFNMLNEMTKLSDEHRFHLHLAMGGSTAEIDQLAERKNVVIHRHAGPWGRHIAVPLNIWRTHSCVYCMLNGNTGKLRVGVPCPVAALFHDMRLVLCKDIYGDKVCHDFAAEARKWIVRRELIVTGSETVKSEIVNFFGIQPAKILVASEGADHRSHSLLEEKPEKLFKDRPFFLNINPGERRKNWQLVVKGFAAYLMENQHDQKTILVFAGDLRDQRSPFFEMLDQYPILSERVIALGYVENRHLLYLLRNAIACVYPSLYEGFGIPIVEAMMEGTPVIVSDIPVFREVAGEAAFFTPVDDPMKLGALLKQLKEDEKLRLFLVEKGRLQAKHFTWKKGAERLLDSLSLMATS